MAGSPLLFSWLGVSWCMTVVSWSRCVCVAGQGMLRRDVRGANTRVGGGVQGVGTL
jgi:hypothetical protein